MKLSRIAFFSLFLTACTLKNTDFVLPERVDFQGKSYEKVTHNAIDEMQQSLYLPADSAQDPENWHKGILFFLDQNVKNITLNERVLSRQNAYEKQNGTLAKVKVEGNELRSEVIYPPTERFNDVLLEVSRGREMQCGYGQIQVSEKQAVKNAKNFANLTAYTQKITQLALALSQLAWQIECK